MSKLIPENIDKCTGCELCVLEAQRQLKKVGLEGALIRIFRKQERKTEYLKYGIDIDPRIEQLNLEKIKNICPRAVYKIIQENESKI